MSHCSTLSGLMITTLKFLRATSSWSSETFWPSFRERS